MIITLIVAGVLFILGLIDLIVQKNEAKDIFCASLTVSILIVFMGFLLSATIFQSNVGTKEEVDSETPIYSLETSMGVEGQFVLGTGSVESKLVYVYYTKDKNTGYYKISYINSKNVLVKETDDMQPCIQYITEVTNETSWWLGFGDWFLGADSYYILIVPKGTVKSIYNGIRCRKIDLKASENDFKEFLKVTGVIEDDVKSFYYTWDKYYFGEER